MDFDHIIIGAGSAGCVLADRLSACGRRRVLLVEAGGSDRRFWMRVPLGYGRTFFDPRVNWRLQTCADPGLNGRRGYWPRGRVLGGSSSINAMVFVRGLPEDFDDWEAQGNPGWGWADVAPVFRRLERFAGGDPGWRGRDGPLPVTDPGAQLHPTCADFLAAGVQAGLGRSADINGPDPEGVTTYQITTERGLRASAATAWLRPAMGRANLTVMTGALARRLTFEGTRATGVELRHRGQVVTARAHGGVILCAGAIGSAQLLQLSGVGAGERLAACGVAPVHSLPAVGRNLQDHLCIDHLYRARRPTLNDALGTPMRRVWAGLRYLATRAGPLALSLNQAGGFVRSDPGATRPDLQLYFSPLSYTRAPSGRRPLMHPDPFPGFLLGAQPCRPASRGHLEIRSPDPTAAPDIHPGSLSDPADLAALLAGARLLRRLAATPALAALIAQELSPGPTVTDDAALVEDIRARASTVFHPCGTCRMGPDPATSVVDARLRVHGLEGLRVVDASVFPAVTSGNTNAPTLMLAERGADLILEDTRA